MKARSNAQKWIQWTMVPLLAAAVGVGTAQGPQEHDDHGDRDRGSQDHGNQGRGNQGRGDQDREDQDRGNHGRGNQGDNGNHGDGNRGNGNGNHGNNFRFRDQDRQNFQPHYSKDVDRWRNRPQGRPQFYAGQRVPDNYRFQYVPPSYYRSAPPPPPGYQYGYYDGYVVAYNPATRIIADVLDLVVAASR